MEFVLGRFSYFNIAIAYSNSTFCGAWTPSFCEFTWKLKILAKRAHPWIILNHYSFCVFMCFYVLSTPLRTMSQGRGGGRGGPGGCQSFLCLYSSVYIFERFRLPSSYHFCHTTYLFLDLPSLLSTSAHLFLINYWKTWVFFVEILIPPSPFWTSSNVCPGFLS